MRIRSNVILSLLAGATLVQGCQSEGGAPDAGNFAVAEQAAADEAASDSIVVPDFFPPEEFLSTPAAIDAWVKYVDAGLNKFERKGPYTIPRSEGNYEVTAYLYGGEIIMLFCNTPGGLAQQWYYLDHYLVPTFREQGRTLEGRYYERRIYFAGTDRRLAARERSSKDREDLPMARWGRFEPADAGDFRLDPQAVRQSALKFIAGE